MIARIENPSTPTPPLRTGGIAAPAGAADDPRMQRAHAALDADDPPWRERLLDVPDDVPRVAWLGRIALLVVVALWGMSVVFGRMTDPAGVLHLTLILFHEAGHVVFAPFGQTIRVAGGTLGQLLIPLACAVALHRRGDNFGAAIASSWLALSLIDASVYAYDAADPVLPLIGGGTGADSFHDFVFLFERTGQLAHARSWAVLMKVVGGLALSASLAWGAVL
ncbi:MAG: hypothetical protein JO090_13430, partial [Rhizobacter sp.]|nr:hypothetical protein [Rhizobacter sp.]